MPRGQYAMIMKFTDRPPKPTKKQQKANSSSSEADRLGGLFSTEQVNFNQSGVQADFNPNLPQPERPEFDAAATISKFTHSEEHPQMNAWKQRMKHYRLESGATQGEMQLPECAPLVFPAIDRAAIRMRDGLEPKSNFQSGRTWVRDYIDRKSQASFVSTTSIFHFLTHPKEYVLTGSRKPSIRGLWWLSPSQGGRPSLHDTMTPTTQ